MRTGIKKSGFARRGLTAVGGLSVIGGLLIGMAAPASAAISGESISPATWAAGAQDAAVVTWTESSSSSNTAAFNNTDPSLGGNFISVEVGWGWVLTGANPTGTPVPYAATWDGTAKTYTCATIGVVFASSGFSNTTSSSGSGAQCLVRRSSAYSGNPGQQVVLANIGSGNNFNFTGSASISVTFPSGKVTAPSAGPASDTWRIVSLTQANTVTVTTTVPALDSNGNPLALITIDIDPNGGTCKTAKVTGYEGTWGVAPDRFNCTRGVDILTGYNTSADGSGISIAPEGNIHFTGDNRVYAQWFDPRTQAIPAGPVRNVVATSKWSRVQVNWDAPLEQGSFPVTNYLVQATPGRSVCITRLTDKKLTQCSFNNLTPGTKYTFKAQALTQAGWGEMSVASNQAAPYEVRATGSDRKKGGLFQLFKSEAKVSGTAKGYPAGTRIHSWYKLGDGAWAEGSEVKSDASGNFKWSKKFERKYDGTTIQVQFSAEPLGSPWIKNAKYNSESMDFSNIVTVGKAK
jgi:hypothetical protein